MKMILLKSIFSCFQLISVLFCLILYLKVTTQAVYLNTLKVLTSLWSKRKVNKQFISFHYTYVLT